MKQKLNKLIAFVLCMSFMAAYTPHVAASEVLGEPYAPDKSVVTVDYYGFDETVLSSFTDGEEVTDSDVLSELGILEEFPDADVVKVFYHEPAYDEQLNRALVGRVIGYENYSSITWGNSLAGTLIDIALGVVGVGGFLSAAVQDIVDALEMVLGSAIDMFTTSGTVKIGYSTLSKRKEAQLNVGGSWVTYYTSFGEQKYKHEYLSLTHPGGSSGEYILNYTPNNFQGLPYPAYQVAYGPNFNLENNLIANANRVYENNMGYSYEDGTGIHWGDIGE